MHHDHTTRPSAVPIRNGVVASAATELGSPSLALYFMHYNFCRKHSTIKTTPAIKAGLTNRIWTLHDLANLPDLMRDGVAA